jgi:folate-dependent phosphoribosylglycinamide formyltransferase PurN
MGDERLRNVVLLAGHGDSTWYTANALHRNIGLRAVILERPVGRIQMLKSRARRLGWVKALGQGAFILATRLLDWESRARAAEIIRMHDLSATPPASIDIFEVPSVSDPATIELLLNLKPYVVVVSGTRIISRTVLNASDAIFINMHAGITPKYRGVHGAYWALYQADKENAGATVHLVDSGVDTGGILYQVRIDPGPRDNFCTYPLLQLAAGLPLLTRAVEDALADRLTELSGVEPSRQYYHPTLLQYLLARIKRGVR